METGIVKWFDANKGFGFIQPTDGSKDVFVHISEVERSGVGMLQQGDKVSFQPELGLRGKIAAGQLQRA